MKRLLTLLFITSILVVKSQQGTLDKSFGNSGIIISQTYSGDCNDLIVQNDGKIISIGAGSYGKVYGGFFLACYNTDGTLDLSFGDSGRVATNVPSREIYAYYGAIQEDGKIVVAGYVDKQGDGNNLAVMRYNATGTIDSSFGNNGFNEEVLGQYEFPSGILVQPDGKIVIAGYTTDYSDENAQPPTIYLVRYNEDGSHDLSFGNKGIHQEVVQDAFDAAGLILQLDGKLLIGGASYGTDNYPFFLRRYAKDGSPDIKFGVNGEAKYYFKNEDADYGSTLRAIALQADGKIIAAGTTYSPYLGNATLVRFNANGSTDKTFGNHGVAITPSGDAMLGLQIKDIVIAANGKIIAGAIKYVDYPFYSDFTSISYNVNGTIDSTFGANGIEVTSLNAQSTTNTIALQPDGKFILGGNLYNPKDVIKYRAALARYNGDDLGKQPLLVRIKRWLLHHGISWQIQPNKEVRYYSVQRSADGIVYKEIAKLSNKQQVNNYEDVAITGSSYYRLAAIGLDGSRTYSNTVLIDESSNVKMFPNPVRDNLQLQGLATGKTSVSIVDLHGNVRSSAVAAGSNYSVNTSQLMPGNYLLKLQHNNVTTTQPFVKE